MSYRYRFDRFELRPTEQMLYVDGAPSLLGARAMDVLLVLVERAGRLVSKHELLDLVWPGLVVEENNLQVQVSSLRKVLGPAVITTVPGRGYRFTASVQLELAGESGELLASPPPLPQLGAAPEPPPAPSVLSVLPLPPGRLWGRDRDLALLHDQRLSHPLITVVGAGGIGKTAFALTMAHAWRGEFRDGAGWVNLVGVSDERLVVSAVTQAVGLPTGGGDPAAALVAALAPLKLLLVLDNAEHVLEAVARLAQAIVAGAPGVRLLVTSQAPLKLPAERVFRLGALSVPPPDAAVQDALQHGAVALFVDQAQGLDRRFALSEANVATAIALCRRLDGVPLALKLAASRVPLLGLQGLWERLQDRFKLLTGPQGQAPARQQTLLATLDWSHELLGEAERRVFRRLSAFAGGVTLAQATAVAGDDGQDDWDVIEALGTLVDRSLVAVDAADAPRYRLPESVREYALLKLLQEGEHAELRRRHARVMAAMMAQAYEEYWTGRDEAWLQAWAADIDNVRAGLDWSATHDPALAVELIGGAGTLFMLLGLAAEYRQRAQLLEPHALALGTTPAAARYWLERGRLHWGIANRQMHDCAARAALAYRALADARGLYLALRCQVGSGMLPWRDSAALLEEMARLESPDWPARLGLQRLLAQSAALRAGQQAATARQAAQTVLVRAQAAGLDAFASAALCDLAAIGLQLGDLAEAAQRCDQLLARGRHRRDNFVVHALALLAGAAFRRSDLDAARQALDAFVAACRARDWEWLGLYAALLAQLAAREGRLEAAARLLGYTDQAFQQLGSIDALMLEVRTGVAATVHHALDEETVARLAAEGAAMDAETACRWALTQGEA